MSTLRLLKALIFACFITTGCKYQYYSYNSSLSNGPDQRYYAESDSVQINYEFTSGGIMKVNITNKSKKKILANWKKSSITFSDKRITYFEDDSLFGPNLMAKPPVESEILPNEKETRRFRSLSNDFKKLKSYDFERIRIHKRKAKKYAFNPIDSLKSFKSQIFVLKENKKSEVFSHKFWIGELVETRLNKDFPLPPNEIKTDKMTASGQIFLTMATIPLALVWLWLTCDDCHE